MIISPLHYRLIHPLHRHLLLLVWVLNLLDPLVVPGQAVVSPPRIIIGRLIQIPTQSGSGIRGNFLPQLLVKVDLIPLVTLASLRA